MRYFECLGSKYNFLKIQPSSTLAKFRKSELYIFALENIIKLILFKKKRSSFMKHFHISFHCVIDSAVNSMYRSGSYHIPLKCIRRQGTIVHSELVFNI